MLDSASLGPGMLLIGFVILFAGGAIIFFDERDVNSLIAGASIAVSGLIVTLVGLIIWMRPHLFGKAWKIMSEHTLINALILCAIATAVIVFGFIICTRVRRYFKDRSHLRAPKGKSV